MARWRIRVAAPTPATIAPSSASPPDFAWHHPCLRQLTGNPAFINDCASGLERRAILATQTAWSGGGLRPGAISAVRRTLSAIDASVARSGACGRHAAPRQAPRRMTQELAAVATATPCRAVRLGPIKATAQDFGASSGTFCFACLRPEGRRRCRAPGGNRSSLGPQISPGHLAPEPRVASRAPSVAWLAAPGPRPRRPFVARGAVHDPPYFAKPRFSSRPGGLANASQLLSTQRGSAG